MSPFVTKAFWMATGERAIKTFAQSLLAIITGQAVGIIDFDWGQGMSLAGMAALGSLLFSIINAGPGPGDAAQEAHGVGSGGDSPDERPSELSPTPPAGIRQE